MQRAIVEGRVGGRCYTEQIDGTECDWGTVLQWDPPHRFVMAWQITHEWGFEPDIARASEVEVRFIAEGENTTLVELEHRLFERMGAEGGTKMHDAVDRGWPHQVALPASACASPVSSTARWRR